MVKMLHHDVILLSSWSLPDIHEDDLLLKKSLENENLRVKICPWEDFDPSLEEPSSVLFRSTWGYYREESLFKRLLRSLDRKNISVWNSLSLMRWNLHKSYLIDLKKRGVPIIPTKLLENPQNMELENLLDHYESDDLIIKPAIGASAFNTLHISPGDWLDDFEAPWKELRKKAVIVQPFIHSVVSEGEYSLIFIDGEFSHCVRKKPAEGDFRVQIEHGGSVHLISAPPRALQAARAAIHSLPEEPLYARVDLVRSPNNHFLLMELELIEPELFLSLEPKASSRLAAAISKQI